MLLGEKKILIPGVTQSSCAEASCFSSCRVALCRTKAFLFSRGSGFGGSHALTSVRKTTAPFPKPKLSAFLEPVLETAYLFWDHELGLTHISSHWPGVSQPMWKKRPVVTPLGVVLPLAVFVPCFVKPARNRDAVGCLGHTPKVAKKTAGCLFFI